MTKLISIGQIIDKTWDTYRFNFPQMMKIMLWLFVSSVFFIIGVIMAPVGDTSFLFSQGLVTPIQTIGMIIASPLTWLVTLAITLWTFISVVLIIDGTRSNKKQDIKSIQKIGFKKLPQFTIVSLLRWLIKESSILAIAPGILLILWNLSSGVNLILGGLSILVTFIGIIVGFVFFTLFSIQFAFAGLENVIGGKGIVASIKGSRNLVKNRFWATLIRLIIPKLLIVMIIALIGSSLFFLNMLLITSLPTIIDTDAFYRVLSILQQSLTVGLTILTLPLFWIVDYIIYDNLRKTK